MYKCTNTLPVENRKVSMEMGSIYPQSRNQNCPIRYLTLNKLYCVKLYIRHHLLVCSAVVLIILQNSSFRGFKCQHNKLCSYLPTRGLMERVCGTQSSTMPSTLVSGTRTVVCVHACVRVYVMRACMHARVCVSTYLCNLASYNINRYLFVVIPPGTYHGHS